MRATVFMAELLLLLLLFTPATAWWPCDPDTNLPICTAVGDQSVPQLVGDGSGGAIITWDDSRSGSTRDIYAQRVDANGDTLWPADGVAICTAAFEQYIPQLVGDGSGGAIITWCDYRSGSYADIYAQRVDANGDTFWPANGVAICTAAASQYDPQLVGDGSGGAIITWEDYRSGSNRDIYAQRVDANGDTLWPANGLAISTAAASQYDPQLVGDGSGGAIITWEDYRSGNFDIYAQRVNFNGVLGPVPHIISINDVPEDQGGQVAIFWDCSYLDAPEYQMITHYSIWRKYPWGPEIESMGEPWDGSFPKGFAPVVYRRMEREDGSSENKTQYWEYMGSVEAHLFEVYVSVQPTFHDSSASGVPYCSFFISAHAGEPFPYWDSAPDSGYSVDNIEPAKTQVGILASGSAKGSVSTICLSWNKVTTGVDGSPEQGPIDYRVYCEEDPELTPGPGNLLTVTNNLSYAHTDSRIGDPATNLFYLVTVVDGSDNESAISNRVGEFDRGLSNGVK